MRERSSSSKMTYRLTQEMLRTASILEVLSANLDCGARVVIEAVGTDEQEALELPGNTAVTFL